MNSEYQLDDEVFVWGVLACDDNGLDGCTPSMRTMNDLDITYNKKTKLYSLSIETIYIFDSVRCELNYLINLLDKFTDWMEECAYSTNYKVSSADVLNPINGQKFSSIEQAYAWFKFQVISFVRMHDFD